MTKIINSTNPRRLIDRINEEQKLGFEVERIWYELRLFDFIFFKRYLYVYFCKLTNARLGKISLQTVFGPARDIPLPDQEV